jgi:UDP-glucose 4-epimerase
MKVLITGGLGYIGGRLALHLGEVYKQKNIRLLSRKKDKSRIPSWASGFELAVGDVLDEESLMRACLGMDAVVHLAALNEIDSGNDPKAALRVNGEGTLYTLKAAVEAGVKRFIYFSTYHVYGLNSRGTISEDTLPLPIHPYSITHHVAEGFTRMVSQKNDVRCTIVRLSNSFGCPADPFVNRWTLAFNDMCLQAVLSNKIALKSSGKGHRDFITLTDVSRAVEHLFKIDDYEITNQDLTLNLGGENSLSILDAARKVAYQAEQVFGRKPKVIPGVDKKPIDDRPVDYRIDRFKKLGFKLKSNVDKEITETLRFCGRNREELKRHLT